MRNTVKLVVLMLLFSTAINAQNSPNKRADFAPEQQATLQAKRMALNFDLDKNQQKAVYKMMLNKAEERESIRNKRQLKREKGTTLTQEERFEFENNRLDRQLAHKEEMKKILTAEQFEKWNNFKNCNKHFSKNKHQKRREAAPKFKSNRM
jgi:periplasmic protein CpxP/Spy